MMSDGKPIPVLTSGADSQMRGKTVQMVLSEGQQMVSNGHLQWWPGHDEWEAACGHVWDREAADGGQ